jgi:hypothetical protein
MSTRGEIDALAEALRELPAPALSAEVQARTLRLARAELRKPGLLSWAGLGLAWDGRAVPALVLLGGIAYGVGTVLRLATIYGGT